VSRTNRQRREANLWAIIAVIMVATIGATAVIIWALYTAVTG
jgi:hypothetical protein